MATDELTSVPRRGSRRRTSHSQQLIGMEWCHSAIIGVKAPSSWGCFVPCTAHSAGERLSKWGLFARSY
jgi:hypothetical protein